jgi:hypothetical protein
MVDLNTVILETVACQGSVTNCTARLTCFEANGPETRDAFLLELGIFV